MEFVSGRVLWVPARWTPRWTYGFAPEFLGMRGGTFDPTGSETEREEPCSSERIVVMVRVRLPTIYPDSFDLRPTGSALVFSLLTEFAQSPPSRPSREKSCPTQKKLQKMFVKAVKTMRSVEMIFESLIIDPGEALPVREAYALRAASAVAKCLLAFQSRMSRARTKCLGCSNPPVAAPCVGGGMNIVEVQYNRYCSSGYTTLDAVSILPPLREFHAPLLCRLHRQELEILMHGVVAPPNWPWPPDTATRRWVFPVVASSEWPVPVDVVRTRNTVYRIRRVPNDGQPFTPRSNHPMAPLRNQNQNRDVSGLRSCLSTDV